MRGPQPGLGRRNRTLRIRVLCVLISGVSLVCWSPSAAVARRSPSNTAPIVVRLTAAHSAPQPTAPFGDGFPFPGPLPVSIPAGGGTIQAANFNSGPAQQAFHACTPGDQGNAAYRSDPHDIDIFRASATTAYIQSSSAYTSHDPVHDCPNVSSLFSDYVKYSFTVTATGWYELTAAARHGQFSTLVDNVNKGLSPTTGTAWSNVLLAPAVYLTAGRTHVLTIELLGFDVDLDAVYVAPTTMDAPLPRMVSAPLTKNEVVVADAVATDKPFGAAANNTHVDNRAAIQAALTVVRFEGGGTVFLPGGVYTVRGPLFIPANVTLRGDWSSTPSANGQTILAADVPVGSIGKPFISLLGTNAALSHMSIWYPNQSVEHPRRYPPTIRAFAASVSVSDVTLFDSDQGVFYREGSTSDISTLKATCFTTCIVDGNDAEYSFITNVTVSNQIWASAPSAVKNRPTRPADLRLLDDWTTKHLTAIQLFRNDNLTMYGVAVTDARRGIVADPGACTPRCITYGSFSKISASIDQGAHTNVNAAMPAVDHLMDTDLVSQAANIAYRFAPSRVPGRTSVSDFYNVRSAPFFASGDGLTDDTGPIQSALNTAGSRGGGTVYLPAGTYLVSTHLLVPSGVELRGSYSARHTAETVDGTTLLAVEGQGTSNPNTDTAFISLAAHAGIHGISVRYPNQGFGSDGYPVTPFPYTVRSLGAQTWMLDVNVLNGYLIADFATYRSDGFVINNVWATAFSTGVNAGGGSQHGWIQRVVISYGDLYRSRYGNSPHSYGLDPILKYTSNHVVAYDVGDVYGLESLGANSFTVEHNLVAYRTSNSAPGLTNSTFFASSSDSASLAGVVLSAGTNIAFVGLLAVSPYDHNDLFTVPAFKGSATIYDATLNPGGLVRQGGTLNMFPES